MLRNAKVLLIALAVVVMAGSAYAFAAANTLDDTTIEVGYSSDTVAGYTIDNVAYDLDDSDPTQVNKVTFTIDPVTATFIQVRVDASEVTAWEDCVNVTGTVTCTFSSPYAAANIDTFDVIVSSSANATD